MNKDLKFSYAYNATGRAIGHERTVKKLKIRNVQ